MVGKIVSFILQCTIHCTLTQLHHFIAWDGGHLGVFEWKALSKVTCTKVAYVKECKLEQVERRWQLAAVAEVERMHRDRPQYQWKHEEGDFHRRKIYE